uniref:GspE/PulE family protein n=1 Tax=Dialister hominis TaxID=2582419 RepID=UPI0040280C6B
DRVTMMRAMKKPIAVRAKVVGSRDIAESLLPQDGSYSETVDGVSYDFRISTLPSLYGETIVIRILSGKVDFIENNHLGMMDVQEKLFMKCLRRKAGMILTTGPTGSGKTSTLYAALRLLNDPSVNIISIEDPVEYRIEGVTQIQVNKKAGLTFEKGLRSIVRQDPDILMVGEIRDRETAEIAVHAALTGHLVLSTLHTVNAASAPLRLMDMGIAPYLLADSLSLIISQRIPGRLCPHCKRKVTLTEEKFADLSLPKEFLGETVMDAEGCEECHGSGIAGRIGAFEMIEIGREERQIIRGGFSADKLQERMRAQGQPDMGAAALRELRKGWISARSASQVIAGED